MTPYRTPAPTHCDDCGSVNDRCSACSARNDKIPPLAKVGVALVMLGALRGLWLVPEDARTVAEDLRDVMCVTAHAEPPDAASTASCVGWDGRGAIREVPCSGFQDLLAAPVEQRVDHLIGDGGTVSWPASDFARDPARNGPMLITSPVQTHDSLVWSGGSWSSSTGGTVTITGGPP